MDSTLISIRAKGDHFVITNNVTSEKATVHWESLSSTFRDIKNRNECIEILVAFVHEEGAPLPLITAGAEKLITRVVRNSHKHS